MARTSFQYTYCDFHTTHHRFRELLDERGYRYLTENGEHVFKCGKGFWTAMKYIKIEYAPNNLVTFFGWVRSTLGREQDLKGFSCAAEKKQVLSLMEELGEQIV